MKIDFRVYLLTDRKLCPGGEILETVERALDGGVRAVQLREKDLSGRELFRLAERMRKLTEGYGARLLINDRADVAMGVGADGVHLGVLSIPPREARRFLGPQAVIVDDILDTGGTLISACETLRRAGVQEIIVMVTHGLFTGSLWERLWSLGVGRIYCTDTAPLPPRLASTRIAVLSVAPLLCDYLAPRGAG